MSKRVVVEDLDCVIKRLINDKGETKWEALYINGIKELECFEIDIDKALSIFSPDYNKQPVLAEYFDYETDNDSTIMITSFPISDDFIYLLDYTDIQTCDSVWLEDGEYIIKEVWEDIRPSGHYKYYDYEYNTEDGSESIIEKETETYYIEHPTTFFKVVGSDKIYVWEDYNYRQSILVQF